jgi:hypothetical protein
VDLFDEETVPLLEQQEQQLEHGSVDPPGQLQLEGGQQPQLRQLLWGAWLGFWEELVEVLCCRRM